MRPGRSPSTKKNEPPTTMGIGGAHGKRIENKRPRGPGPKSVREDDDYLVSPIGQIRGQPNRLTTTAGSGCPAGLERETPAHGSRPPHSEVRYGHSHRPYRIRAQSPVR